MVAGIIQLCGAYGGKVLGATRHNQRGQFENRQVTDTIIKPYLHMQGYDPMGQHPLPDVDHLFQFDNLRQRMEAIFRADGYTGGPWYWKGAKACLIWPVIHKAFPEAKWVIVRRKDQQIVESCLRTGFMRKHTTAEGWQGWVNAHKQRFAEMKAATQVREVWPEKFFVGDFLEIKGVVDWLGLEWNGNAVVDFVSPALWNGGKK